MENTAQEEVKETKTSAQEQYQEKSRPISIADIWTQTAKSYWDAMMWKQPENGDPEKSYLPPIMKNGKRAKNAWNTSITMFKSLSMAMINPDMINSFVKTTDDLPETFLKIQRNELDRFFKWHSDILGKTENIEKLVQLMCLRTFK